MEQFRIEIRYDGIDAGDNVIDMRLFGESLIGLERALSTGLNAIAHGAIPRSRAKPTLEIKASPVRPGSVELDAIVEIAKGALPLITPFLIQHGPKIARLLISAIVKRGAGQKKQSEADVDQLVELAKINAADRAGERQLIFDLVDRLAPAASAIVAPVGRSCEALQISDGTHTTEVDVPMAQAVRSKAELEVSDMMTMRIRIDGVVVHTRTLKVEDPDEPGRFVSAEVRDPAFTDGENIYTRSVTKFLNVQAKATYRDGRLFKLHIMDAKETE